MKYLLSIVIPTQNRQKYCDLSVKQIYDVTDERIQIIVQDNSTDNSLHDMIKQRGYSDRVQYYYIEKKIPCSENYNIAISHTEGDYVCCIGDDDGIFAQITDVVEFAKKYNITAIRPNVGAIYYWPSVSDNSEGKVILGTHSTDYRFANPKTELKKLLQNGCQGYLSMDLVKAYHGIVKKECFEDVYEKTGRYCGALSSDMFMCVALSLCCDDRIVAIDHPITISGACRQSTSGDAINKCNYGKLESAPHFVGQDYEWSDKVPAFYCGNTIWADSALHSLNAMDQNDLLKYFDLEKLSAICYAKFRGFKKEIFDNLRKNNGKWLSFYKYFLQIKLSAIISFVKSGIYKLFRVLKGNSSSSIDIGKFPECVDIIEAEAVMRPLINDSLKSLLFELSNSIDKEDTNGRNTEEE